MQANDYYPFGMGMPERKYQPENGYRYGFNGKENDKEVSTDKYDFGARIYDGRIGRWLSVDPLQKKYPSESPYIFAGNSPIVVIDKGGKYKYVVILDYDASTGKYTLIGIRKENGLKASTIERKEQTCSNCGSFLIYEDEWYDYITFDVTVINGGGKQWEIIIPDIYVGGVKSTTPHEGWGSGEPDENDINRGGMMWTTSKKGGVQGAGIYGKPDNIENIDDWSQMVEKFEEISNYGVKQEDIDEVAYKLIEAIKQVENPLGRAETSNKPTDLLNEVLAIVRKIAPDEPSENVKAVQKAKDNYENKFKVKKFNDRPFQTTKYKDTTWSGKTTDGRDSSSSWTIEVPIIN